MEQNGDLLTSAGIRPRWQQSLSFALFAIGDETATHLWLLRLTYPLTILMMAIGLIGHYLGAPLSIFQIVWLGGAMLVLTWAEQKASDLHPKSWTLLSPRICEGHGRVWSSSAYRIGGWYLV